MKEMWERLERYLRIAELCRAKVTELGPDSDFAWVVGEMGAEAENKARWMADVLGCTTHIRILRA